MPITPRPYQGDHDKTAMMSLVRLAPQENLHIIDLPYRLSSWAFDDPDNVCLWQNERAEVLAWAVLQAPFWTIDCAQHPAAPATLYREMLAWADARARALPGSSYGRPAWFVNVFEWQHQRRRDLEACGFASQADAGADSWSKVFMLRPATIPLPTAPLPPGFSIRPLDGVAEVDAYVTLHRAAFESESMTAGWRRRTLEHPDYYADLDLVALDPTGQLAAFCICWFSNHGVAGRPSGQIEPLGVRADVRKCGLGRAILAEGMRRLYQHGAERIAVETDNYRNAALTLYEALGFRVDQNVLVYRQDYPNAGD